MPLGQSIQATLGLDSSRFRAGLDTAVAQSQTAGKRMAKNFQSAIGGARLTNILLTALAINPQQIANRIAEWFTGGSQEAFKAGEQAADKFAEAFRARRVRGMSLEQRDQFFQRELKQAEAVLIATDKIQNSAKRTQAISEANLKVLEAQEQVDRNRLEIRNQEAARAKEIAEIDRQLSSFERDNLLRQMTGAEQLHFLNKELLQLDEERNALSITDVERGRAELGILQKIQEIKNKEREIAERESAERQGKLDDLKKMRRESEMLADTARKRIGALIEQRRELERQSAASEKMRTAPTLAQVASGERFIGGRAGSQARELERLGTREQRLSDREQRLREQAARRPQDQNIQRELDKVVTERETARGRRETLEDALRDRVTDITQSQLDKLIEIEVGQRAQTEQLEALNRELKAIDAETART